MTSKKLKKISVLIISKNSKNTIKRCIDSVYIQKYPNIELVIVDSSNDGTEKILKTYKSTKNIDLKLIFQKPNGCAVARNKALNTSTGDIIFTFDSDDYIAKNFIQKITEPYNKHNKILHVFVKGKYKSSTKTLFSNILELYESIQNIHLNNPYNNYFVCRSATPKKFELAIGQYNETLDAGEDIYRAKKEMQIKNEFIKNGYINKTVNTTRIFERQNRTFSTHWKKRMWYAKALMNKDFFMLNWRINTPKILVSTYITLYPLLIFLFQNQNTTNIILLSTIPTLILTKFIYGGLKLKAHPIKILFLPAIIYYNMLFTFLGFLSQIKTNILKLISTPKKQ